MGQLEWKIINNDNSSLIKQNGGSQSGCHKKTKDATFSLKQTFLTPDTHTYVHVSEGKKCSFYRNSEHAFVIVSGTTLRIDIKIPLFGPHAEKLNHGTMIKTGITCNKIHCYIHDSANTWFIAKKAKIFWSYVKHFWILVGVRKWRILIVLCK